MHPTAPGGGRGSAFYHEASGNKSFTGKENFPATMDESEIYNRTTLGSTSSVNKIIHPDIQIGPATVKVPARMMLGLLLEQLNIPDAVYRRRQYSQNTVSVTVIFYTSAQINGINTPQMTITSVRSANQEVAEDSAAVAAIRYMENATNTVVMDLNYAGFKRMQQDNGYLRLRLDEAFEAIGKLSKGCLIAVRYMCAFSDQLHNIIAHGFPPTRVVDKATNETLMNIEVVANNLKGRSHHLEKKLYTAKRQAQHESMKYSHRSFESDDQRVPITACYRVVHAIPLF